MTWRSAAPGEFLGEQQSGQMTEVGLALYLDMLEQAVKALKEGREPALDRPLAADTEVELRLPAFMPDTYIADVHVRLSLYKRIAAAANEAALDELTAEIIDRFGSLPASAQHLLRIARLKLVARALGIRRLDLGPQGGYVLFEQDNRVDADGGGAHDSEKPARVSPGRRAQAARAGGHCRGRGALQICRRSDEASRQIRRRRGWRPPLRSAAP